jgi:aspartyl-tRNA(Asn)/glutamyl-tRNA(Gln) amidotransferase subunit A
VAVARRLAERPGYEILQMMVEGTVEPEDYVEAVYDRLRRLEPRLNAYITVRSVEEVADEVRASIARARRGERLPLAGLLVAVKDNISTRGLPTTCASRMLLNYIPPYDATVVERLTLAGAVVMGKTNMDEFAMGSTGETSYFGPTRNPWDPGRVPGGSSSGTAAALASAMATLGLGSDTGGSIRLPAAWTGLYGLKPTYGLVSRYGLVAYAESLEQIGPMARNARDLALLLSAIAGYDPRDSTSIRNQPNPATYLEALSRSELRGLRAAVLVDLAGHEAVDRRVEELVWRVAGVLRELGAEVGEARLGRTVVDYALPAYYVIAVAEASSNLARYDGLRYGFGEKPRPWESWNRFYSRVRRAGFGREVRKRIMLGSWVLSAGYRDQYYVKALKLRRLVAESVLRLLRSYDVLVAPSAVAPPPRLGEVMEDPERMYLLDLANVFANLVGVPAMVVPAGKVDGIPMGVQLVAAPLRDALLLSIAYAYEQATGLHDLVAS